MIPVPRLALLARGHGATGRRVAALGAAWLLAAVLCRIGIPPVDPTYVPVPRPLETLGTLAVCLPASLHASLLRDASAWLTAASPRAGALARLPWLAVTSLGWAVGTAGWVLTLPGSVPRVHAAGVCALAYGLALCSVRLLSSDLATLLPALAVGVFTWGELVPFDENVVYNVAMTDKLWAWTLATLVLGCAAVGRWGARDGSA